MKTATLAQVNAPDLPKVIAVENVEIHRQSDYSVVLHKAGCQHRSERDADVQPFDVASHTQYGDDWYYVAPCAKRAS